MAAKVTVYTTDFYFTDYLKHLRERRNDNDAISLLVSLVKDEHYMIEFSIDAGDITDKIGKLMMVNFS